MANWNDVLAEIQTTGSVFDQVRRKHLDALHNLTGRNTVIYYSGWLQKEQLAKQGVAGFEMNDGDKTGFMSAFHDLDRSKGLDLILHTPGGGIAATESIVEYIRSMFGTDVRAIVPDLAMSAGTMVALSCREILMGKHSSIGPIDPQIGSIAAHGVVEEFETAMAQIKADPSTIPIWQPIIAKYNPTLIGECQKAVKWANDMVRNWLKSGMFANDPDPEAKAKRVVDELGSHILTLSHARHVSLDGARGLGIKVVPLEEDQALQDAVLTVHHATTITLQASPAIKIIENHRGMAHISSINVQVDAVQIQPPQPQP